MPKQYRLQAAPKAKSGRSEAISTATPVLASFQLEQTGRQLRVVDHDGSIYSGYLQSASLEGVAVSTRQSISNRIAQELDQSVQPVAADLAATAASAPQTYFFRVSGTNVSLNQRVTFWGKLMETNNVVLPQPYAPVPQLQPGAEFQSTAPQSRLLSPGISKRLSGKAVVGDKAEMTIEAVSPSSKK
jgi:hypothetical protein